MSNEVIDPSLRQEAWELCKEYLAGPWSEVSLDAFKVFHLKGGFSNSLYRCVLPENINEDTSKTPKNALLRLYGILQRDAYDAMKDTVVFLLMSEKKIGPKLYGVFPTGRLEEFIPSHTLCAAEHRKYAPYIARELAKLHATDVPLSKRPDLWSRYMKNLFVESKEFFDKQDGSFFLTASEYQREIEWVNEEMKRTKSPIVFCHNDLSGGNILYREDKLENAEPKIMLIDFELGNYTYRGMDIAEDMIQSCFQYNIGGEVCTVDFEKFPSKEEQIQYCATYLDQLTKEGVELRRSLKEELEAMVEEINIFACAVNLRWSLYFINWYSFQKLEDLNPTVKEIIQKYGKMASNEKKIQGTESASSDDLGEENSSQMMHEVLKVFYEARMKFYNIFKQRYLEANSGKKIRFTET